MSRGWVFGVLLSTLACSSGSSEPAATPAGTPAPAAPAGPSPLSARSFAPPAPWAEPIADYVAAGEAKGLAFSRAIHALAAHAGRLYFGYGDANVNMGENIPIEFRWFASPDDPAAQRDLASSEEQIDRFRVIDGALWQAGIDANDTDELSDRPLIKGNVYRLDGATWRKHRSVPGAEHVHDVAGFRGAVYAVGSGADDRTEWEGGRIFRYLWRSDDRAASFRTVAREMNTQGDTRWTQLLALRDSLYLFGYASVGSSGALTNAVSDGEVARPLAADHPLAKLHAFHTDALPDGTGLLRGRDVRETDARVHVWHLAGDATPTRLDAFEGLTVDDVAFVDETRELLFLTHDGSRADYNPKSYRVHVVVAPLSSPGDIVEIGSFASTPRPTSIAHFGGAIFVGDDAGHVLKAAAAATE